MPLARLLFALLCLGSLFAWSAWAPELMRLYGYRTVEVQAVFGLGVAISGVLMFWSGRHHPRLGPRRLTLWGGLAQVGGWTLAALLPERGMALALGVGLGVGGGIGLAYLGPFFQVARSRPGHEAARTGWAAAAFGLAPVVYAVPGTWLLGRGVPLSWLFAVQAVLVVPCVLGVLPLLPGPDPSAAGAAHLPLRAALREPRFWLLVAVVFPPALAGLMILGNLKLIALGALGATAAAAWAIPLHAAANGPGRVLWGLALHRWGLRLLPASLLLASASTLLLACGGTGLLQLLGAALAGLSFGGIFVLLPGGAARLYPAPQVPAAYGLVFLTYTLAALLGPALGGLGRDLAGGYAWPLLGAAALCLLAAWAAAAGVRRLQAGAR